MYRVGFLMLAYALAAWSAPDSTAVADDREHNRVGLGASLETLTTLDEWGQVGTGTVFLPCRVGRRTLLEPFVGLYHEQQTRADPEGGTLWSGLRSWEAGLGVFHVRRTRGIDWLLGLRISKEWMVRESVGHWAPGGRISAQRLTLGPTLGAEYAFPGGFTVGAELGLQIRDLSASDSDFQASTQRIRTNILLRYYFGDRASSDPR